MWICLLSAILKKKDDDDDDGGGDDDDGDDGDGDDDISGQSKTLKAFLDDVLCFMDSITKFHRVDLGQGVFCRQLSQV